MQPTPPPLDLWSGLDPDVPIALVPVRLEVRFGTRVENLPDGTTTPVSVLKVRIYPDEISVIRSSNGLWDAELAAGNAFWAAQTRAQGADEDLESFTHSRVAAWDVLASQVGIHRAVFVANETRSGAAVAGRQGTPPTARLLPDSWVIIGESGDTPVFAHFVARPGDDPQTGSAATGQTFDPKDALLVAPDDPTRWLTDFPAAVAIGMAAEIDLETVEQAQSGQHPASVTQGLSRLYVIGVRGTAAPVPIEEGARTFADLLTGHAAADKLALVAQGTPTNNLTDRPSGLRSASDPYAGYRQVIDPVGPPAGLAAGVPALRGGAPDGPVLEAALGVDAGITDGLDGAGRHEQWLSRNMALALFPVTIGEVVGNLARPINTAVADDYERYLRLASEGYPFARDHMASFVRGRGTLPAIRVGHQPYGVLPIMSPEGWVRQPEEPAETDVLVSLLGKLRWFFRRATLVPMLAGAARPEAQLTRILGHGPVPHPGGYRVREVVGPAAGASLNALRWLDGYQDIAGPQIAEGVAQSGVLNQEVQLAGTRHLLARAIDDLITNTEFEQMRVSGAKPMSAWVARTDNNRQGWKSPSDYLKGLLAEHRRILFPDHARPTDLLFVMAERAVDLASEIDSYLVGAVVAPGLTKNALTVPVELASPALSVAAPRVALLTQTLEVLAPEAASLPAQLRDKSIAEVVADDDMFGMLSQSFLDQGFKAPVGNVKITLDAIDVLGSFGGDHGELDDDGYTRLTGELLACATNRLDAWYSSLAAQRLATLRARKPSGLQIGAWGVLVDVQPTSLSGAVTPRRWQDHLTDRGVTPPAVLRPRDPVGYVHAPSLQQAITAGVLRAGELAHRGDNSSVASVDLTSKRARIATELVEAMSNGQPFGALLGYRLERSMHAAGLHLGVRALRDKYPQRRVDGAPGDPAAGTDSVVPAEVLDGLDVWHNRANVKAQTAEVNTPAFDDVLAELDQAVEAVADLIVAEGVHQITTGRTEAAGATFTAVAQGLRPPEITVTNEPRSGVTIMHRVVLALDTAGGANGWAADAPRARLAPEAEVWAQSTLGAATDRQVIVGGATVGLDTLGLCALDVLVESAPLPHGIAPESPPRVGPEPGRAPCPLDTRCIADSQLLELARAASAVLATSRPAVPADLSVPPTPADDTVNAGTVNAVEPPSRADLQPIADRIATQLDDIGTAVDSVTAAAFGQEPEALVPSALLAPLARLGVAGCVIAGDEVTAAAAVAGASAADAIRRDVYKLISQGQPNAATSRGVPPTPPPPPAPAPRPTEVDESNWPAMLADVCDSTTGLDTLTKIIRRIGGEALVPTIEADSGLGDATVPDVPAQDVEHWLSRTSRVRPALSRFDDLCLFQEAAGQPMPELTPCHLPATENLAWLGGPLAPDPDPENEHRRWKRPRSEGIGDKPDRHHSHVVVAGPAALATAPTLRGIVLDEVAEVIPMPSVTTGLAVHYDAPNARPPQTVLLAVSPNTALPWTWWMLRATVSEAMALARLRGVELDDLVPTGIEEYLPLTYVREDEDGTVMKSLAPDVRWSRTMVDANRVVGVKF